MRHLAVGHSDGWLTRKWKPDMDGNCQYQCDRSHGDHHHHADWRKRHRCDHHSDRYGSDLRLDLHSKFAPSGANGVASVTTTPANLAWTATSNQTWLTFPTGNTGTGNQNLNFAVATNTSMGERMATITVTGGAAIGTLTITQQASNRPQHQSIQCTQYPRFRWLRLLHLHHQQLRLTMVGSQRSDLVDVYALVRNRERYD